MEKSGFKCSPPKTDLLIDLTLTYPERVFRIGRRMLAFMAVLYLTEEERKVTAEDFRRRHVDALMTNKELVKCFRYLTTLIPQIGYYDIRKQQIVLTKRPSFKKIKSRLQEIQLMTEENFKVELARISKRKTGIISTTRPKVTQKATLEKWFDKSMVSDSSLPYYLTEVMSATSGAIAF